MARERASNSSLRSASAIIYQEVRERARLISEAIRGLEPAQDPLEELSPAPDSTAVDELAPAYELTPRRATGT
jgi:hypothetical protein